MYPSYTRSTRSIFTWAMRCRRSSIQKAKKYTVGPRKRGSFARLRHHGGADADLGDVGEVARHRLAVLLVGDLPDIDRERLGSVEMGRRVAGHGGDTERLDEVASGPRGDDAQHGVRHEPACRPGSSRSRPRGSCRPHRPQRRTVLPSSSASRASTDACPGPSVVRISYSSSRLFEMALELGQGLGHAALAGSGVDDQNHRSERRAHRPRAPGFMMPFGSIAAFTARRTSIQPCHSASIQPAFSRPTPW